MPLLQTALVAVTLLIGAGIVTTAVLWRRRGRSRRMRVAAVVLGVLTVALAVAQDAAPRLLTSRDVTAGCLGTTVRASPASTPVAWQVLTGGLRIQVRIDADQVRAAIGKRIADSPLAGATVRLSDDAVTLTGHVATAFGDLPLEIAVVPALTGGQLSFVPATVRVAGQDVPPEALNRLSGGEGSLGNALSGSAECGERFGSRSATVSAVDVTPDGLTVTLRL